MLTIQPPLIREYFTKKKNVAQKVKAFRRFYLSWEDALWHLLTIYKVKPGSKILVPEFFCVNVIDHMREHNLEIVTYPVDRDLHTQTQEFVNKLREAKPQIVLIFHPAGIENHLIDSSTEWLPYLGNDGIIIEDCVHKILDSGNITFLSNKHFLIDSLRKVVPIQGSYVYSPIELPTLPKWKSIIVLPYRILVTAYWIIMQINLLLAYYSKNRELRDMHNLRAERAMIAGYELIGSQKLPSPGVKIMEWLSRRIAAKEIADCKEWQAKMYMNSLQELFKTELFWLPKMDVSDYSNLRGFPLIIDLSIADKFLRHLRESGILVRFELNDSIWSKKQKIVYLPMGIHLDLEDLRVISKAINTKSNSFE